MKPDLADLIEQISLLRAYANRVDQVFPEVALINADEVNILSPSVVQLVTRTWALLATNLHAKLVRDASEGLSDEVAGYLYNLAAGSLGNLSRHIHALATIQKANSTG